MRCTLRIDKRKEDVMYAILVSFATAIISKGINGIALYLVHNEASAAFLTVAGLAIILAVLLCK